MRRKIDRQLRHFSEIIYNNTINRTHLPWVADLLVMYKRIEGKNMGKIIKFPISKIQLQSFLSERIEAILGSLPKDISDCLRDSFLEISSFSIVKQKSFDLVVPDSLSDEELYHVKVGVEEIIKSYEKDILPVLKRLAEKEAELCMLKFNVSQ